MGLTVAHVARVEQLTVRRVRQIIAEMLASREIDPPAGFVQFQIARLSEAMIVARTMMLQGNLQAMDRLIKLTSELDRYHGFAPAQIPAPPERPVKRLAASALRLTNSTRRRPEARSLPEPLASRRERLTAKPSRPEMAPQQAEKIESVPRNGMGSEASYPQDMVDARAADRARLRLSNRENDEAKFSASQSTEIDRNRERISQTSPTPPRQAVPLDVAVFDPW
jgi:hypothetical protein